MNVIKRPLGKGSRLLTSTLAINQIPLFGLIYNYNRSRFSPEAHKPGQKAALFPLRGGRGPCRAEPRDLPRSRPALVEGFTHLQELPPQKGSEMYCHLICLQPWLINFSLGTDLSPLGQQLSYLCFLPDFQFPLSAVWEDLKSRLLRREGCSSKAKLSLLTQFTGVTESKELKLLQAWLRSLAIHTARGQGFWGPKRAGTAPRERAQLLLFMETTIFSSLGHIHFLAGWWGWNGVKPMPRPTCHVH